MYSRIAHVKGGLEPLCICMQGLSHYLEHMLFCGSAEFTGMSDFSDFIELHSGGTNAFTTSEMTNFHFQVDGARLEEALQRFSAFFKDPLCLESALVKEV